MMGQRLNPPCLPSRPTLLKNSSRKARRSCVQVAKEPLGTKGAA